MATSAQAAAAAAPPGTTLIDALTATIAGTIRPVSEIFQAVFDEVMALKNKVKDLVTWQSSVDTTLGHCEQCDFSWCSDRYFVFERVDFAIDCTG